jgi:heavy metal efflux system protein
VSLADKYVLDQIRLKGAIVIVGGLIAALAMSLVLLPTLYVRIARDNDKLPETEESVEG